MKQNKYIMKEFEEILIKNNYKKFYYNNKKKIYTNKEVYISSLGISSYFYEKDKKVLFAVLLINNLPLLTFIPSNRMYQVENMPDGKKLINGDKYEVFQKILNLWESDDYQTLLNILENSKLWIVLNKDKDNYKITIQEIKQEFI